MASNSAEETSTGKRDGIVRALLIIAFGALIIWVAYRATTATERNNLESAKALLHDPYSAVFSNVRTSGKSTCGLVNAKNLMGAYTGEEMFFVSDGVARIGEDARDMARRTQGVCSVEAEIGAIRASLGRN